MFCILLANPTVHPVPHPTPFPYCQPQGLPHLLVLGSPHAPHALVLPAKCRALSRGYSWRWKQNTQGPGLQGATGCLLRPMCLCIGQYMLSVHFLFGPGNTKRNSLSPAVNRLLSGVGRDAREMVIGSATQHLVKGLGKRGLMLGALDTDRLLSSCFPREGKG